MRFTFETPTGARTVRAADEATARALLEAGLHHPDPGGEGGEPYTAEQAQQIARQRAERAAAFRRI